MFELLIDRKRSPTLLYIDIEKVSHTSSLCTAPSVPPHRRARSQSTPSSASARSKLCLSVCDSVHLGCARCFHLLLSRYGAAAGADRDFDLLSLGSFPFLQRK